MRKCSNLFLKCLRFICLFPMMLTICIALVFAVASPAHSSKVILDLSPGAQKGIDGHKVYYGTSSENYTYCVDLFTSTSCVISGLEDGRTYYFAATSYDSSGFESKFSNEVKKYIPIESSASEYEADTEELIVGTESGDFTTGPAVWDRSTFSPGAYSAYYHYAPPGDGRMWAKWKFTIQSPGNIEIFALWTEAPNRSPEAPYTIVNNGSEVTVTVNQTKNGGQFVSLGTYWIEAGLVEVLLRDVESGYVIADAIKLVIQ